MTQQVRNGYRKHRRGAWAATLVLVAVAAAALTPLAIGGAAQKYYTLTASPTTVCYTGAGQSQGFTLTLTNQSRNTILGSANITAPSFVTLLPNSLTGAPGSIDGNTVQLRNLNLTTVPITVTVAASIDSIGDGYWTSVAKQSNDFADAPGPGNLLTLSGGDPRLTAAQCTYAFTNNTPHDALRDTAQTVTVELQANGVSMPGSGQLDLEAYQGRDNSTTPVAPGVFSGLSTTASNGFWTFPDVTGAVSGANYRLRVKGADAFSRYFTIADCIPDPSHSCDIPFKPSDAGGSAGGSANGTQIGSPIALSFSSIAAGAGICNAYWGWTPLTLPDGSTFDGIALSDYSYSNVKGYLKLVLYLRNDLYVRTSPSNTNDILICAGGKHSGTTWDNGLAENAFMGRDGHPAVWDEGSRLYWGVLERVPNCNKSYYLAGDNIPDPVLCAWGTQDVTFNGVTQKYRTATVLVPADWDWSMKG